MKDKETDDKIQENGEKLEDTIKRKYSKPTVVSEDLTVFGAVCNGTAIGGRKASPGPPAFCDPSRINS